MWFLFACIAFCGQRHACVLLSVCRAVQIPTVGFLYIAGYIGYVGRSYIRLVKGEQKPTQKEIIIDVPTALKLSAQGATWPLKVIQELRNGTLVEQDDKITVSPR